MSAEKFIATPSNYGTVIGWEDYEQTIPILAKRSNPERSGRFPSVAVPDMAIPLGDLLKRYRRGSDVAIYEGAFNGPGDIIPDGFERMDEMDRIELLRDVASKVSEGRSILQKRNAEKNAAAQKAAFDDAVRKAAAASAVDKDAPSV